ncbi:peroxisomal biogenesis factor 11 [Schizopora paradoxa]|uniref:Peroxisomal biogenesis factor 11 n=1 Tax=Schizopora paradoxa TaxID=27342 RepID=A0A0H2SES7_9AGAM|nr:peroxisomal biogenesis factor 11 [Schizopora paradoxa]
MATIASQVILHPTATQTLKVLGTTVGRDKVYRAVQFFARFLAWFLTDKGFATEAARWNSLKTHLAIGRKLMRLGKPLEHLQAALKAFFAQGRPGEQITTIVRQLGYFGYLCYDALVWANTIKFITLTKDNATKYNNRASRLWLLGIVSSIINGILKANRLANESKRLRSSGGEDVGSEQEKVSKFRAIEGDRVAARYQFVQDLLDVWIPASNLGYIELNDGVIGICGTLSSLMGLRTQWYAVNKAK